MTLRRIAGLIGLALIAAVCALLWYALGVPGRAHVGPLPALSAAEADLAQRLERHVRAIASSPHNARHPAELERAARYIEATLRDLGFASEAQSYDVAGQSVRNIVATIAPRVTHPKTETLVIGAHYDSFFDAPGANDNGTGTAAVIELARLLRTHTPAHVRLRFVLFANEEPPFFQTGGMGSVRFAQLLAE